MRPEVKAWLEEALWDLENAQLTPWGHIVSVFFADYLQATKKNRDELIECAKDLDRHYIPSRYPFGSMDIAPHKLYTKKIAAEARCCAE